MGKEAVKDSPFEYSYAAEISTFQPKIAGRPFKTSICSFLGFLSL